jgi:hypothetical protein
MTYCPPSFVCEENNFGTICDRVPTASIHSSDTEHLISTAVVPVAVAAHLAGACSSFAGFAHVVVGTAQPPSSFVLQRHHIAGMDVATPLLVDPKDLPATSENEEDHRDEL